MSFNNEELRRLSVSIKMTNSIYSTVYVRCCEISIDKVKNILKKNNDLKFIGQEFGLLIYITTYIIDKRKEYNVDNDNLGEEIKISFSEKIFAMISCEQ